MPWAREEHSHFQLPTRQKEHYRRSCCLDTVMTWHLTTRAMQRSPFPLGLSTLVDMWRMSKILAVQSLLLVMSMLLSTGLT